MEFKVLNDANEEILELRNQAFVVEKNVPKNIEFDGKDAEFMHFCLYDDGSLIGCARGDVNGRFLHVGRVAVKSHLRNKGYGKQLFEHIEQYAKSIKVSAIELGAIETAVGFYEKAGFHTVGDFYSEAGWPHINMVKNII